VPLAAGLGRGPLLLLAAALGQGLPLLLLAAALGLQLLLLLLLLAAARGLDLLLLLRGAALGRGQLPPLLRAAARGLSLLLLLLPPLLRAAALGPGLLLLLAVALELELLLLVAALGRGLQPALVLLGVADSALVAAGAVRTGENHAATRLRLPATGLGTWCVQPGHCLCLPRVGRASRAPASRANSHLPQHV